MSLIPVQLQPIQTSATSPLPNIGNFLGVSSNAPQVPPALTSLPPGTTLRGFVLNRAPGGTPVLRTEFGDFLVQSKAFLRIGAEVAIRIRASGANFRADIVEIDGKPVTEENAKAAGRQGPSSTSPAASERADAWQARQDRIQQTQQLPTLDNQGNVRGNFQFQGVLLNPTTDAVNKLQLRQGAALIIRLFNLQLPTGSAPSNPPSPPTTPATQAVATQNHLAAGTQGNTPASGNQAQPTTAGSTNSATSNTTKVAQQYQQLQPTTSTASTSATVQNTTNPTVLPQNTHALNVIGHEQDGDPVIQTPFGLVKITSKTSLPTGSVLQAQISLDPNAQANPSTATQTTAMGDIVPTPLIRLSQSWPALEQILQFLQTDQATGGVNQAAISGLPQVLVNSSANIQVQPIQFSSGLFIFFAALGGGDFRNFLGAQNISKLQQAGKTSLLNQAQADFAQLARLAGDSSSQWQANLFPVAVGGQVEMVHWFTRRHGRNHDENTNEPEATRFIIEMNTSMLGELQLDGLYRLQDENKKLDLVLRSYTELDSETKQAIMQIVTEVNDITGLHGSITFQSAQQFPEHPMEEVLKDIPDIMA